MHKIIEQKKWFPINFEEVIRVATITYPLSILTFISLENIKKERLVAKLCYSSNLYRSVCKILSVDVYIYLKFSIANVPQLHLGQ